MFTPRPSPGILAREDPDRGTSPARRRVIEIFRLKQGIGRQRPVEFIPCARSSSSTGIMVSISSVPYDRLRPRADSARRPECAVRHTKFGPQIVMQNSNHFVQKRGVIASAISRSGKCVVASATRVLRSPASSPLFSPANALRKIGMTGKRNACVVNDAFMHGAVISAANSPFRQPSHARASVSPHNAHFQPLTAPH